MKALQNKKIVHWLLIVLTALYLLSGLAITNFQLAEKLSSGLLTKLIVFKLHSALFWPFMVVLALHIYYTLGQRVKATTQ